MPLAIFSTVALLPWGPNWWAFIMLSLCPGSNFVECSFFCEYLCSQNSVDAPNRRETRARISEASMRTREVALQDRVHHNRNWVHDFGNWNYATSATHQSHIHFQKDLYLSIDETQAQKRYCIFCGHLVMTYRATAVSSSFSFKPTWLNAIVPTLVRVKPQSWSV